jgi:glycosyltransferase involved in cell wall biosynthesis
MMDYIFCVSSNLGIPGHFMKVLILAFACNPYQGSEPGIGWNLVSSIARRHDVFLITDDHNRGGLERANAEGRVPTNVTIRYLRESRPSNPNRLIAHLQCWMSYAEFNRLVLGVAEVWHREETFDLCHQVTIAAWRMPSPLWRLPIPFVWGPIGGAGFIPPAFRSMLSVPARMFETARDASTWISSRSQAFRKCIQNTRVVIAANKETEDFLVPYRDGLPMVRLPSGSITPQRIEKFTNPEARHPTERPLSLFAGGNMEGRKGVSLALRALKGVAKAGLDFHYTIAGGGPEFQSLQSLSVHLGLSDKVTFHSGYQGQDYVNALHDTDVYFLPSFRETTPATLLEAYLAGCYPVVADASAQGEIVRMAGGHAIHAESEDEMVAGLTEAVIWCAEHRSEIQWLAAKSRSIIIDYFSSERHDAVLEDVYAMATTPKASNLSRLIKT